MEINHYLNNTLIDEPIGFDSLQLRIDRGEYHGISVEVSMSNLEFYGLAYSIIFDAYNTDIDTVVEYRVVVVIDGAEEEAYRGVVDLSTCSFQYSEYRSVSAKVGDIGAKTTFNNRLKVDVDLESGKTVDQVDMEPATWHSLNIPNKHLLYTNKESQTGTKLFEKPLNYPGDQYIRFGGSDSNYQYLQIPLTRVSANEFGSFNQAAGAILFSDKTYSDMDYQYAPNDDFESMYGTNTVANIDFNLKANLIPRVTGTGNISAQVTVQIMGKTPDEEIYTMFAKSFAYSYFQTNKNNRIDISMRMQGSLPANKAIAYFLRVYIPSPYVLYCNIEVLDGSYFKMTMYDTLEAKETPTDLILVHDALNVVAHAISENALSVKSDWYGSAVSKWEGVSTNGGGALKALTNGYKIRGLFSSESLKRNMPVSFARLIDAMSAIDCIGWGFEERNDGTTCVRVERWNHFYKDEVVATLINAGQITTEVDSQAIITEFTIGYEKFSSTDQYNSIDSIHGVRKFTSGIKAVSGSLTKKCEFIADNYAIEETRRARYDVSEAEETSYDESIFVFELIRQGDLKFGSNNPPVLLIGHTATGATNVGRSDELINAKISPRHNAARWKDYLFRAISSSALKFTSGEINYIGAFGVIPESSGSITYLKDSLKTFADSDVQEENANIINVRSALSAEIVSFYYPLTISQYKAIKANPYGLINYGTGAGWIKELTYKLHEGIASFKLIKKCKS